MIQLVCFFPFSNFTARSQTHGSYFPNCWRSKAGWSMWLILPSLSVWTLLSPVDWGRKEWEKGLLVVADVGISRWKFILFHNPEKVDEEVCLSIHQLQLILLLLSAILPLSLRISSDSSSSFRPCISIISFQHSHCIPISTFPCHAVAKSWVLSCLMFPSGQLCFPAVTDPSSPKCPSISSMQRHFPPQLSQFIHRNNPSLQFLQKNKSPPWSWCLYIVTMLFLTVLLCSECFPPHCSVNVGQAVMMQHTEKHLSPVIIDSPWNYFLESHSWPFWVMLSCEQMDKVMDGEERNGTMIEKGLYND